MMENLALVNLRLLKYKGVQLSEEFFPIESQKKHSRIFSILLVLFVIVLIGTTIIYSFPYINTSIEKKAPKQEVLPDLKNNSKKQIRQNSDQVDIKDQRRDTEVTNDEIGQLNESIGGNIQDYSTGNEPKLL